MIAEPLVQGTENRCDPPLCPFANSWLMSGRRGVSFVTRGAQLARTTGRNEALRQSCLRSWALRAQPQAVWRMVLPPCFHGRLHIDSKANLPDSLSLRSAEAAISTGKMAATSPNNAWRSNLLPPFGNIAPHPWRCLELDQRWSEDQRHHYFVEPLGNKL
jgi:hypothetical protein